MTAHELDATSPPKRPGKNKGDWSEFYTFLRLLSEGRMFGCNGDLEPNANVVYPIIKIPRNSTPDVEFERGHEILVRHPSGEILRRISPEAMASYANHILSGIERGAGLSFWIPVADEILDLLCLDRICDDASQTSDIRLVVLDPVSKATPLLGFSIKSYLGGKPTLFNASNSTNFVFKVTPMPDDEVVSAINSLDSYGDRLKQLLSEGYRLELSHLLSETFESNLRQIDSNLPEILGTMLLKTYTTRASKLSELTETTAALNPFDYNLRIAPKTYEYKVKRFLVDAALGMTAGTPWTGEFNAAGGHIVVKSTGEIVCFHAVNWNDLQNYLFHNTKFEKPSSSRHKYGTLYRDLDRKGDASVFINLNLQIRFI